MLFVPAKAPIALFTEEIEDTLELIIPNILLCVNLKLGDFGDYIINFAVNVIQGNCLNGISIARDLLSSLDPYRVRNSIGLAIHSVDLIQSLHRIKRISMRSLSTSLPTQLIVQSNLQVRLRFSENRGLAPMEVVEIVTG